MTNKVKEYIGFHSLSTKIQLWYLIHLELNIFPKEILSQIKDKTIAHNIFRIQSYGTVMCGSYCMALIEYMIAGKTLLDSTNLFSPNDNEKNCEIIHKLF